MTHCERPQEWSQEMPDCSSHPSLQYSLANSTVPRHYDRWSYLSQKCPAEPSQSPGPQIKLVWAGVFCLTTTPRLLLLFQHHRHTVEHVTVQPYPFLLLFASGIEPWLCHLPDKTPTKVSEALFPLSDREQGLLPRCRHRDCN